jgi:hypothetical protein
MFWSNVLPSSSEPTKKPSKKMAQSGRQAQPLWLPLPSCLGFLFGLFFDPEDGGSMFL